MRITRRQLRRIIEMAMIKPEPADPAVDNLIDSGEEENIKMCLRRGILWGARGQTPEILKELGRRSYPKDNDSNMRERSRPSSAA